MHGSWLLLIILCASDVRGDAYLEATNGPVKGRVTESLARTIHECCREAFETEARLGLSQVRATEANAQSVEEANEKSHAGREDWTKFMKSPG
jgi:hypothetical protein